MAIDGIYNVQYRLAESSSVGTITLKADGSSLSGSLVSDRGPYQFEGGKVTSMGLSGPCR